MLEAIRSSAISSSEIPSTSNGALDTLDAGYLDPAIFDFVGFVDREQENSHSLEVSGHFNWACVYRAQRHRSNKLHHFRFAACTTRHEYIMRNARMPQHFMRNRLEGGEDIRRADDRRG